MGNTLFRSFILCWGIDAGGSDATTATDPVEIHLKTDSNRMQNWLISFIGFWGFWFISWANKSAGFRDFGTGLEYSDPIRLRWSWSTFGSLMESINQPMWIMIRWQYFDHQSIRGRKRDSYEKTIWLAIWSPIGSSTRAAIDHGTTIKDGFN